MILSHVYPVDRYFSSEAVEDGFRNMISASAHDLTYMFTRVNYLSVP